MMKQTITSGKNYCSKQEITVKKSPAEEVLGRASDEVIAKAVENMLINDKQQEKKGRKK